MQPDWGAARYGSSSERKAACARAYELTGHRCCHCLKKIKYPDGEVHEVRYWAWYRFALDLIQFASGKCRRDVWGVVRGRWWHGWDTFPLHSKCHQRNDSRNTAHAEQNWIKSKFKPELFNRNRFSYRWRLRVNWLLLRLLRWK